NRVNDGRLVYNENLYKSLISIFKPTYNMNDFILIGEMKPAKETDSSLHYLVKEIDESDSFYKLLSQGKYVSQETEGTYEQILEFQMYGAMTMLCKNKCIIKRGLRYTVYRRSCNKDILHAQYLIPCVLD
ncbi:AraC family transcriptional regulator, partial [Escherichia coli]